MFNDFVASLYDPWFNYELYSDLLDAVFNAFDFQKLGIAYLVVSIVCLLVFYKVLDPIKKPRLKWLLTTVCSGILMLIVCCVLLYNNNEVLMSIASYSPSQPNAINPEYFIIQMAAITFLYGVITAMLLSVLMKYLSAANTKNPF
ncbi:hypothetical protein [Gaetbulibacter sp. PBL-D1]|uniref:hypothetical protein n=1 Tax=Gaetbulibacter sp. PBL-D1 TaxID=3422594 RepID=UPI003D2EC76B